MAPGEQSTLTKLLRGIADGFDRLSQRATALLLEMVPSGSTELLPDWERVLGLPDDCATEISQSTEDRRKAVVSKLAIQGSQSVSFYVTLLDALGYSVSVNEYPSFTFAGVTPDLFTNPDWKYTFEVVAPAVSVRQFRAGQNRAGDRLISYGNQLLECTIERYKPAHTRAVFSYF